MKSFGGRKEEKQRTLWQVPTPEVRTRLVTRRYDNWLHSRNFKKAEPTDC